MFKFEINHKTEVYNNSNQLLDTTDNMLISEFNNEEEAIIYLLKNYYSIKSKNINIDQVLTKTIQITNPTNWNQYININISIKKLN